LFLSVVEQRGRVAEPKVVNVSIEYIERPSEGPIREEEVIVVEHEPEPPIEIAPSDIGQGKHRSIYTY